jgi:hypothetical protein
MFKLFSIGMKASPLEVKVNLGVWAIRKDHAIPPN